MHEFAGAGEDGALPRGPGDHDAATAAELKQSFVPEQPQRPQYRVGVDVQHGGQVLRGTVTWNLVSPGMWRLVLPTKVVASEHISNNYDQTFRFALPPGKYVLVGRYDRGNAVTFHEVSVSAGKVIREDLPDVCA